MAKKKLNKNFALAREIIHGHKFSVYAIFLTRTKDFNSCKCFGTFYDDFE